MSFFTGLLGPQLLTPSGPHDTSSVLSGKKHIMLYFSAHWCPPCQGFTPILAKFYEKAALLSLEVVFVSADRQPGEFQEYYNGMPWCAVPYESPCREEVARKYGERRLPNLVIFDPSGKIIKKGAVEDLHEDPEGRHFPWPAPTWEQALGTRFMRKDGTMVGLEALKGKKVGIYCSAHWCPPCRQFTPALAEFYRQYTAKDPNFEIIFCSSDRSKDEMMSYFREAHGNYLCFEFDSPSRVAMGRFVEAQGIPTFAVYSETGQLINKEGRALVGLGAAKVASLGWEPPLVCDLSLQQVVNQGTDLNECPAVVVRCGSCDDDEQAAIKQVMEEVAKSFKQAKPDVIFYIATRSGGPVEQLGELTKENGSARCAAPDSNLLLLLFDMPNGCFYESPVTDLTVPNLKQFVEDFKAQRLSKKSLGAPPRPPH